MAEHYNIAIIGTGPGGYVAALKAGAMGAKCAVVEKSHLGGTCLNWGCIPSKALLASAELMHHIQDAAELGIDVKGEVGFDWTRIQGRKDRIVGTLRSGIGALFKSRKVTLHQGRATLNGPGKVAVAGDDGKTTEFTADKIILAVGSVPSRIPNWPTDPQLVCTSDEGLHWKELPKRLLIVGGGVIGCEFACMFQPFGVQVTVVEMMPHLLPFQDADLGAALEKAFKKRGIKCYTDTSVKGIETPGNGIKAVLSNGETIEADKVLVATGRWPNTKDIGLESVGLTTERGFIRVNEKMETPVKGYYCIGDANGRCLLAHAASAHGVTAVENALGADKAFDAPIPSTIYTFPEIAAVGMTAAEARNQGLPISVGNFPLGTLGKAMAVGDRDGFVKVVRHRETGQLLGVHMMGHNVTEVIAAAGAMLHEKVSVEEMAEVVFAHPTISEGLKEGAEDALSMALHMAPRKVVRAKV
ncbi:MAG: dihydrolipoyl dehydrogenase [Phycisphaerae bacterium]|nr:dihydrolipoyl dehydrogenase [Phycisphaerae bacterium]